MQGPSKPKLPTLQLQPIYDRRLCLAAGGHNFRAPARVEHCDWKSDLYQKTPPQDRFQPSRGISDRVDFH